MIFNIDKDKCIQCGKCVEACPRHTIIKDDNRVFIEQENCIHCGLCESICPVDAVFSEQPQPKIEKKCGDDCVQCNTSPQKKNETDSYYRTLLSKPRFYKYLGIAAGILFMIRTMYKGMRALKRLSE